MKYLSWILICIMASVVLASGCTQTGQVINQTAQTPQTPQLNTGGTAETGDTVRVSYEGRHTSGEVFDSGEISFEVGAGMMIQGFDEAVRGMALEEEKEVTIPPEKAYGEYDPSMIETAPLRQEIDKTDEAPLTAEQFRNNVGEEPVAGNLYDTPWAPWTIKVLEVGESTIKLEHMPLEGQTIQLSHGTGTVSLEGDKVVITVEPYIGRTIQTAYGPAKILEGDSEDEIRIDFNHELAGKTLVFRIKILEIEKPVKYDKPVLDAFIMSYCPYGIQMAKALIPVQELLGDKADINIRFVYYTMHGQKEADENNRMMCLREEQPEKFWQYMKCFTESGDSNECISEAGIDKENLDDCMKNRASGYYDGDKALNTKYDVGGSPTVALNGKVISVSRSPEAVKEKICSTFDAMPEECSQALSNAQTSPGFGSGSGGGSGSCE